MIRKLNLDCVQKLPSPQSRLERALRILLLFSARREWRSEDLMRLLGVSRRTFFRDIHLLRSTGFEIETSLEEGNSLFSMEPVLSIACLPNDEEYLALLLAVQHAGTVATEDEQLALERLLAKLVAVGPQAS